MKKRLLYVLALALFVFAMTVLVVHFLSLPTRIERITAKSMPPFSYAGRIMTLRPEGEVAGLRQGDVIVEMNGRTMNSNVVFFEEMARSSASGAMDLLIRRQVGDAAPEMFSVTVPMVPTMRGFGDYASSVVGLIFNFLLPLFCILVGFWVVLVRVTDFQAWLLLLLMLGFSCLGLEGYPPGTVVGTYTQIFFTTWAGSMFLFGVYFPERLKLDVRFPWLKWIIVGPLCLQLGISFIGLLKSLAGITLIDNIGAGGRFITLTAITVNMLGIGLFFAALGWKSGTLENPDARRRLKLLVYGTSFAMIPSFLIILYGIITGRTGSFYDIAPWWMALAALALLLVFPVMMAYIIVVRRAMDVRVVVRQGLQYAFATGGIRVLQFLMLLGIALVVRYLINAYGFGLGSQVAFIVGGIALIPLIDLFIRRLRVWIDKRFFREAYDAEQILSDLSDDVRTMVETRPLLETVAGKIRESLHVPQVSLLLKQDDKFVPAYSLGFDTEPKIALGSESRSMQKLAAGKHIVLYDDMTEVTSVPTMSLSDREQLTELNSQVLLPVTAKKNLSGIISLSPKRSEEPYTASDLRLLRSVASQTGLALENSRLSEAIAREAAQKERLNTELEIAREVQERLFPQELPNVEGLDFFGACRPALGVGGDYYDFLELADGKFGIAIGDISGKGVGASLMMASLQASLRGQTTHYKDDLAGLMSQVNSLLYEASTTNRYATFFYAQYDPKTKILSYVNAGHNPPFLLRKKGDVEKLEDGGPVVGMLPGMLVDYTQGAVKLASGDLLVGFTDGISEAMNPAEEEWGEDAMLERLKEIRDESATEILKLTISSADAFANGAKQHDDMTMIVVKVLVN